MNLILNWFEHFFGFLALPTQFIRFILVGIVGALIHFGTAMYVSHQHPYLPFVSNAIGFAVAFVFSYLGQRLFTFKGTSTSYFKSLKRWLLISLSGFGLNQGLLWVFLHGASLPYPLAVALAIVLVAFITFLLARLWAFAGAST